MDTEAQTARRVRLAILDDHELLLDSLSSWVAAHARDFELVLTAPTWFELVQSDQFPTDLVLLDFQLQEPVSIEARVRTCRAAGAKVIVLTSLDTAEARDRAFDAGASAFLSKTMPLSEVMETARRVMGMESTGTPVRDWRPLPKGAQHPARPKLSTSEREALVLYAGGSSMSEVASQMNVQYETAKTYLRRTREKYARAGRPASTKADLIRRAAEDGYLQ
ncbi:response regulator transcription factor [Microcella frigidaquae]|uniref:DNA-binding NarL/FixJ family response regulator n=1 Tax=Microcella frigidaquae TaxID=424758 RepID=A0A840XP43_9MICO|nr:response regulator [Microcella frigidaquae]MBB5617689.1 DNA-binding NarL/FixJ family response regulator [Microcella frigidaquae]NHN45709.1 response regulator transcription factor [Microcella frigidaquae]